MRNWNSISPDSAQDNLQTQSGWKYVFGIGVLAGRMRNWNQEE